VAPKVNCRRCKESLSSAQTDAERDCLSIEAYRKGSCAAVCGNGLLSGLDRHLRLPKGFYSALHILILLGFMALARIRRPEGLRHVPPGV
jgi:hypothetical protein